MEHSGYVGLASTKVNIFLKWTSPEPKYWLNTQAEPKIMMDTYATQAVQVEIADKNREMKGGYIYILHISAYHCVMSLCRMQHFRCSLNGISITDHWAILFSWGLSSQASQVNSSESPRFGTFLIIFVFRMSKTMVFSNISLVLTHFSRLQPCHFCVGHGATVQVWYMEVTLSQSLGGKVSQQQWTIHVYNWLVVNKGAKFWKDGGFKDSSFFRHFQASLSIYIFGISWGYCPKRWPSATL